MSLSTIVEHPLREEIKEESFLLGRVMEDETRQELWIPPQSSIPAEYQLLETLGSGAEGIVYHAWHKQMHRHLTIKFLNGQSSKFAQIKDDVGNLGNLEHPNIEKLLQVGARDSDSPFIVYEYLNGTSLKEYLQKRKVLSSRAIHCIFTQVLSALSYAHSKGVIHKNIKPSSIILLPEQSSSSIFHVTLVDFGIGLNSLLNQRGNDETISLSSSSENGIASISCDPSYLSPEQCEQGLLDARSDLYSLTCVLYECLSGHKAFKGSNGLETMHLQRTQNARLPLPGMPKAICEFLKKGLAKDPANRFQNVKEFEQSLKEAISALDRKLLMEPFASYRMALIAAGSLLIGLTIGGVFLLTQEKKSGLVVESKPARQTIQLDLRGSARTQVARIVKEVYALIDRKAPTEDFNSALLQTDQLLPKLRTKSLLYQAHMIKAFIYRHKHEFTNEAHEMHIGLDLCRMPDGTYFKEGMHQLMYFAQDKFSHKNYDESELLARTALLMARKSMNDEAQPELSSESFDLQNSTIWIIKAASVLLNEIYCHKGELDKASAITEQFEKDLFGQYIAEFYEVYTSKSRIALCRGETAKARKLIATFIHDFANTWKHGDGTEDQARVLEAFLNLGDFCLQNHFDREARICFENGVEVGNRDPRTKRIYFYSSCLAKLKEMDEAKR